jgi:hypothetical protein
MTPLEEEHARREEFRLWLDRCRSHRVDSTEALPPVECRHDGIAYGLPVSEDG